MLGGTAIVCSSVRILIGILWRVALALQADGWHLRGYVI
jgi:thiamine monophosphate synthase